MAGPEPVSAEAQAVGQEAAPVQATEPNLGAMVEQALQIAKGTQGGHQKLTEALRTSDDHNRRLEEKVDLLLLGVAQGGGMVSESEDGDGTVAKPPVVNPMVQGIADMQRRQAATDELSRTLTYVDGDIQDRLELAGLTMEDVPQIATLGTLKTTDLVGYFNQVKTAIKAAGHQQRTAKDAKPASEQVEPEGTPLGPPRGSGGFTVDQISNMSSEEYNRQLPAIQQAQREGRIKQ